MKTAEDTGANLIEQASREADLHLKETGFKSDKIVSEAKTKAKDIIESVETKSRQVLEDMIGKVKEIEKQYTDIKNQKEVLLSSLKGF
ncbi:cell division protein DivIVA, partial [Bacteroidota bacterium]